MQVFITEASGTGMIAFSRDGAGHIVPIHGMNFIVNRFTGPGRIGLQSMYLHFPTES